MFIAKDKCDILQLSRATLLNAIHKKGHFQIVEIRTQFKNAPVLIALVLNTSPEYILSQKLKELSTNSFLTPTLVFTMIE